VKRSITILLLLTAAFSAAAGQTQGRRGAETAEAVEEIKRLERTWLIDSYKPNDMSAFDRIVADDFLITHSGGKVLTKAEKRADIIASHNPNSPPSPSDVFRIEDSSVKVRVYGDAAVSIGYIVEKYTYQGKEINDQVRFTNTYIRRQGRRQVVASQLTRLKQK